MEVISRSSSLNPNAALFVPSAYREVEDFSDQWWELVHSTPWFRDYWLQECFEDPQNDLLFASNTELDFETPSLFDFHSQQEDDEEDKEYYYRELLSLGGASKRCGRLMAEIPKYAQKASKIVSVKVNPRPIQQPR